MSTELNKDQKKELKVIFKDFVKNGLKRNASSTRFLKIESMEDETGISIFLKAYFFTIGSAANDDETSIGGTAPWRYNFSFKTKKYSSLDEAYAHLKELIVDPANYKFEKVNTDRYALYKNVFESVFEEA